MTGVIESWTRVFLPTAAAPEVPYLVVFARAGSAGWLVTLPDGPDPCFGTEIDLTGGVPGEGVTS